MPKSLQAKAKGHLQNIWMAETRDEAEKAFDFFIEAYGVKYHKAVERLIKDRDVLLTFYDFPAEHWKHIRTTDEIDKRFRRYRGLILGARMTLWLRATHRPETPSGRLIQTLPA